jgi:hypothetical protein
MAATTGTITFMGLRTRQTYVKDVYLDDTAGNLVRWDAGAGASATSPTEWRPPEHVVMRDASVVTGAAQTRLQLTRNGVPTGDILRQTVHLTTLALRPVLNIAFLKGDQITAIQLA